MLIWSMSNPTWPLPAFLCAFLCTGSGTVGGWWSSLQSSCFPSIPDQNLLQLETAPSSALHWE